MNETVKTVSGGSNHIDSLQEYLTAIRNALAHRNDYGKEKLIFESDDNIEISSLHINTNIGKKSEGNLKEIKIEIEVKKLKFLLKEIGESYLEFFDEKYKDEMSSVLTCWLHTRCTL